MRNRSLDEQLRNATVGSRDLIGFFDVDGRLLYGNTRGQEHSGVPGEGARDPFGHIHPGERIRVEVPRRTE